MCAPVASHGPLYTHHISTIPYVEGAGQGRTGGRQLQSSRGAGSSLLHSSATQPCQYTATEHRIGGVTLAGLARTGAVSHRGTVEGPAAAVVAHLPYDAYFSMPHGI